ncbi:acetyltransferase [Pyrus ussuriensis x Pyrus communis]|uniref:Acetyltransferase n=1 Tax=Pyrus ussuriensis x Pyrus communis TaxID=2448454 RepID=A0A5N5H8D8_9ROSA|nr:acetyltransferase [Pyrus ussuriensis x Pyrus communis]
MDSEHVKQISECFVQPHHAPEESKQPFYLAPADLAMLSVYYIQKGLLFPKPPEAKRDLKNFIDSLLQRLKQSLSVALVHFYPLAGRLVTTKSEDPASYVVYVDCNNSPGAKFIYATLEMSVSDILSPTDVPLVVQSFFDHDRAVNHDGHTMSLLSVQVTELVDGIFIGLSINHSLVDGTSFWHFFNVWSEIFQVQAQEGHNHFVANISRPPVLKRWFPDGHGPIINLPFKHSDEFIGRFEAPLLRERMFHFSSESIAKLKAKANAESDTTKISSFKSLSALLWRTITRARCLAPDQGTSCRLAANNRGRINPPLSGDYFGNSIHPVKSETVAAGELLEHGIGWAAWKLHEAVVNHDDKVIRGQVDAWLKSPSVYLVSYFDPLSVMMGSSPRFNMYGNEFGMGKALALRSGYAHKFSGKVSAYEGREKGSIDLEVCLPPDAMSALECDKEFMEAASVPQY